MCIFIKIPLIKIMFNKIIHLPNKNHKKVVNKTIKNNLKWNKNHKKKFSKKKNRKTLPNKRDLKLRLKLKMEYIRLLLHILTLILKTNC